MSRHPVTAIFFLAKLLALVSDNVTTVDLRSRAQAGKKYSSSGRLFETLDTTCLVLYLFTLAGSWPAKASNYFSNGKLVIPQRCFILVSVLT